nr:hypothetical protein GCM10025699_44900 [Microbacterium flavescens]
MRTKFRWIAALAVGVVAAGSMTACSASGSDGDSDTITYWASNQAPTVEKDAEILQESIDRYTEETGVKVDLEVIPWSDLYNRILTAVSSGEGPDVLNIGNTWAVSLQSSGAFVPWEGDALDAVGGQDRFVQSSFATGGAEDRRPRRSRSTGSPTRCTTTRPCSRPPASPTRRPPGTSSSRTPRS